MDDDFKRSDFFWNGLRILCLRYSAFFLVYEGESKSWINYRVSVLWFVRMPKSSSFFFFFYRDSLESVTTSTVFINCIEITSTVQTLRSKTLQVLWTDANYSSVHKYSFEFWTLQPFRNGKNRQEQFICSHEFWTLQTFKVTKKSQKQFKWSGL